MGILVLLYPSSLVIYMLHNIQREINEKMVLKYNSFNNFHLASTILGCTNYLANVYCECKCYSQTPYYVIDNMYLPSSMRHSITLDFAELYGIGGKGLQAIGTGNEDKGYLVSTAFLDVNQNGIKDKGEPMIENVPIKIENSSELLLTGRDGTTKLKPEDAGIYNVQLSEDNLPTLLSCHSNRSKKIL